MPPSRMTGLVGTKTKAWRRGHAKPYAKGSRPIQASEPRGSGQPFALRSIISAASVSYHRVFHFSLAESRHSRIIAGAPACYGAGATGPLKIEAGANIARSHSLVSRLPSGFRTVRMPAGQIE